MALAPESLILQRLQACAKVLSHQADCIHLLIRVKDVQQLDHMLLTAQLLKDLSLAQGIEKHTISVIERIDLAFFHGDNLAQLFTITFNLL